MNDENAATSTLNDLMQRSGLPPLEARMLMQYATGWSRVSLISRGLDGLSVAQMQLFSDVLERRLKGEPMAYIMGVREFYGRDFNVNSDVLIPRPDTETLIEWVLHECHLSEGQPLEVLDLGTGSGAIAVTLACERPEWRVSAVDVSVGALRVAAENALALGAEVSFFESDWLTAFEGFSPSPKFDLIVSNPPYVATGDEHLSQGDVRFEPLGALTDGADGLTNYAFLVQTVPKYLKDGGQLWFEHGYDQGHAVRHMLTQAGFAAVKTIKDLSGNERVSGGCKATASSFL